MEDDRVDRVVARWAAGLRIDPATAKVWSEWAEMGDPYGEHPHPDGWFDQLARHWFAADPVERVPVWVYDLPEATIEQLQAHACVSDHVGWRQVRVRPGTG